MGLDGGGLGEVEEVGGAVYLASLVDQVPTAANVAYHERIVREEAVLRRLITASAEIAALSYQGSRDGEPILDGAERPGFRRIGFGECRGTVLAAS